MFPNIGDFGTATPPLEWDGMNPFPVGGFEDLGPDQCLVFFLGGIHDFSSGAPPFPPNLMGFAQKPKDPVSKALKDKTLRKGPFYEFPAGRLTQTSKGSNFYVYKDSFGVLPYLMFSSTNNYGAQNTGIYSSGINVETTAGTFNVRPFEQAPRRFLNAESFQIVSGGTDKKFGPGGAWSASNASAYAGDVKDDMANFHSNLLGVP